MAVITLQPNTYNDVTTLAGIAETDPVSIEVKNSDKYIQGKKVLLALLASEPASDDDAQAELVCDNSPSNTRAARTVQGVAGLKIYAWFDSTNGEPIKVMVG